MKLLVTMLLLTFAVGNSQAQLLNKIKQKADAAISKAKNKTTDTRKDSRTIVLAIIPAWLCFKLLPASPVSRNPSNGKAGTSHARFIYGIWSTISNGSEG